MCDNNAAVAVIEFVLAHKQDEPLALLELWSSGEFDTIRKNWENVPDEVFIGADPLFKKTDEPLPKPSPVFDLTKLPIIDDDLHEGYEFSAYGLHVITRSRTHNSLHRCHGCVFNAQNGSCIDLPKDIIPCGLTDYIFEEMVA